MHPFKEYKDGEFHYRTFDANVDIDELLWHVDREDRTIWPMNQTDWLFQMDNELPIKITGEIFIKAGVYHRIIKGSGDLNIKIKKHIPK